MRVRCVVDSPSPGSLRSPPSPGGRGKEAFRIGPRYAQRRARPTRKAATRTPCRFQLRDAASAFSVGRVHGERNTPPHNREGRIYCTTLILPVNTWVGIPARNRPKHPSAGWDRCSSSCRCGSNLISGVLRRLGTRAFARASSDRAGEFVDVEQPATNLEVVRGSGTRPREFACPWRCRFRDGRGTRWRRRRLVPGRMSGTADRARDRR